LRRPVAPTGNGAPVAARQQVQGLFLGGVSLGCNPGQHGAQVLRERRPGAHGIHAAAWQVQVNAGGHVARREHLGVAGGALKRIHRHKTLRIQRQATALQPGGGLRADGDEGHVTGQAGTAGQRDFACFEADRALLDDRDAPFFERLRHPGLHCGQVVGAHRGVAAEQCHRRIRQPVRHRTGQLEPRCAAANQGHAQRLLLPQRQHFGPQRAKHLDRPHKQRVLARTGHHGLDLGPVLHRAAVDRQHVVMQRAAVIECDRARGCIEPAGAALPPADGRVF